MWYFRNLYNKLGELINCKNYKLSPDYNFYDIIYSYLSTLDDNTFNYRIKNIVNILLPGYTFTALIFLSRWSPPPAPGVFFPMPFTYNNNIITFKNMASDENSFKRKLIDELETQNFIKLFNIKYTINNKDVDFIYDQEFENNFITYIKNLFNYKNFVKINDFSKYNSTAKILYPSLNWQKFLLLKQNPSTYTGDILDKVAFVNSLTYNVPLYSTSSVDDFMKYFDKGVGGYFM